jgi:hypothetical protein
LNKRMSEADASTASTAQHEPTTTDVSAAPPTTGTTIAFKVLFGKKTFDVSLASTATVADLKAHLSSADVSGVAVAQQKLMGGGKTLKDELTLADAKITKGQKLMMLATVVAAAEALAGSKPAAAEKAPSGPQLVVVEPLSTQTKHKKILDKGAPEDGLAPHAVRQDALPATGIPGLLNHRGVKVRLTFKAFEQELWIASAESTQKLAYGSIRGIDAEAVQGKPEFSIVTLKLGPTEGSNYYLYFVPTNFVHALKREIL